MKHAFAVLALISVSAVCNATPVVVTLNEKAPVAIVPVLNSMSDGQYPNTVQYVDPATGYGISLGAYFAGQTVGELESQGLLYETLAGQPVTGSPLELRSQGQDKNLEVVDLSVYDPALPRVLGGLLSTPGESHGAVSLLFASDVEIFGLDLLGSNTADPGNVYFQLFGSDGDLIDTETVVAFDGPLWFQSSGAPFRGISITTDDYQGIGYSDLRFKPAPTPPALALIMLGLGLLRLGFVRPR